MNGEYKLKVRDGFQEAGVNISGQQASWKIGLDLLREKCGAKTHLRDFRSQVIAIAHAQTLPEYLMHYSHEAGQVTFLNKKILVP